jgi:hypothetical protein
MKKVIPLFLVVCFCFSFGWSQQITRSVIASTGNYSSSANASLSSTTGEVMVETFASSNHILTQGFQQPLVQESGGGGDDDSTFITEPDGQFNITLYPNPVSNKLHIEFQQEEDLQLQVRNLLGQQIHPPQQFEQRGQRQKYTIDLSSYPEGVYLLQFRNEEGHIQTYKINKVSW